MTKKPQMKELNLAFRGNLKQLNKKAITKLVQHHMAHTTWDIMDVHNYHKNGNGWSGIGYNFWIGFDGTIYVGRGFNQGAHCLSYNDTTIGIGYQGHFDKQQMTDAQLKAGTALNAWLIDQLPNVQANDIVGHGDLGNTACPGKNFRMSELKKGVSSGTVEAPNQQVGSETVTNGSIVDYLNSIGKNSSFSARKKYAVEYGIKGYKGTAKQNTTLLNKMRKGKPSKPKASYIGKRVESKHNGNLRFYSKPSWSDKYVVGHLKKGYGFPTIVDKVKVGNGYQYKAKNSKGHVYYVTASDKYVKVE
ncbi:N-acetylmuramoyl-L-alanine amidase [Virgibacillus salarius]|uniref:N-acetylmuramoyl-L-alanine amidase n=1 Tax=Virgibacillus salarius TaxID=447199 RepID=UPI002493CB45|nr:N-acetylmuramoyl-L-alanine amidase [Virgibacillus salarius]WBX80110.1 N-acetylmuramoyl-L-alanine amidase [Virgibacillus salarius]